MFDKHIQDLAFDDVVEFLKQGRLEGVQLDYKEEMPSALRIAKLVSAFANTNGGFIIFGVKERDQRPVPPFDGADLERDPRELVDQACSSAHLAPPVEPIIGNVLKKDPSLPNALLAVAIPQSGKAPHALAGSGHVYVKVQGMKEPVQPSVDLYERLIEGRRECLDDRTRILQETHSRFGTLWESHGSGPGGFVDHDLGAMPEIRQGVIIDVTVVRSYPDGQALATPQQIIARSDGFRVFANSWPGGILIPAPDAGAMGTFAFGADGDTVQQHEVPVVAVMHAGGAVRSRIQIPFDSKVITVRDNIQTDIESVRAEQITSAAAALVRSAFLWFEEFGCFSALDIEVRLTSVGQEHYIGHLATLLQDAGTPHGYFGPATVDLPFRFRAAWPSQAEWERVAEAVARGYVSSFNVRDEKLVGFYVGRMKKGVEIVKNLP